MIRATTPTHIFTFPEVLQVSELDKALITYEQCDRIVLEKTLDDAAVDADENQLAVTFTQQEMNRFKPGVALMSLKQSEYDALVTKDPNTIYFTTEG